MGVKPSDEFLEEWDAIAAALWTVVDPAGAAWAVSPTDVIKYVGCTLNLNDTARIYTDQTTQCHPYILGLSATFPPYHERFIIEWTAKFDTAQTNIDNALFYMGLAASQLATRGFVNLIGFILDTDNFKGIFDDNGAETLTTTSVALDADWHKFRVIIEKSEIHYFIDNTYLGTITGTSTAKYSPYFVLFVDTDGGGGVNASLGQVYYWYEASIDEPMTIMNQYWGKKDTDDWYVFTVKNREGTYLTGRARTDFTFEYAENDETSWTAYTPGASDFQEIDDGIYAVNIGASEFDTSNASFIVRIVDAQVEMPTQYFMVRVLDKTFDDLIDDVENLTGTGSSDTYNITKNMNQNQTFHNQNTANQSELRNLIVKTKNSVSRIEKKQK